MRALGTATLVLLLAACSPDPKPVAGVAVAEPDSSFVKYEGVWSANGQRLFDRQVTSPDGRYLLEWTPRGIEFSGAGHGLLAGITPTTAPELLWSPSGDKLAISWSEGGAVGPWRVSVITFGADTPTDAGLSQLFLRPSRCAAHGANVAAVAWLGEDELLIAAERPESTCTSGSLVTGIRIGLETGQRDGEIPEEDLLATWRAQLGPRVLNAKGGANGQ